MREKEREREKKMLKSRIYAHIYPSYAIDQSEMTCMPQSNQRPV